jgi:hypothetical protein
MNIDHINPFTGNPTKVPKYSTYLSLPWLTVTLMSNLHDNTDESAEGKGDKRGVGLSYSQQMDAIKQAIDSTSYLGDRFAPHGIVNLVERSKRNEYIDALDNFYGKYRDSLDKSTWFKGQMMFIDFSGKSVGKVSAWL